MSESRDTPALPGYSSASYCGRGFRAKRLTRTAVRLSVTLRALTILDGAHGGCHGDNFRLFVFHLFSPPFFCTIPVVPLAGQQTRPRREISKKVYVGTPHPVGCHSCSFTISGITAIFSSGYKDLHAGLARSGRLNSAGGASLRRRAISQMPQPAFDLDRSHQSTDR